MNTLKAIASFSVIILIACNSSDKKAEKAKDKYEETKETVQQMEKKNPERFLKVTGHDKHNILGQTVIKGNLSNLATVAVYSDINLELSFYSKTGALLEKDNEIIYETLKPGQDTDFKTKYFAPKGSDSVALKVLGAKAE
jgi:hypothetical protein